MEFLADGLLVVGSLTIAVYCFVLSRRLSALKNMDNGLGKAIADLSDQVQNTRASLKETRDQTQTMVKELASLTARAEIAAGRLEILLAKVHDGGARDGAETAPQAQRTKATPLVATRGDGADIRRDLLEELQKIAGNSGRR